MSAERKKMIFSNVTSSPLDIELREKVEVTKCWRCKYWDTEQSPKNVPDAHYCKIMEKVTDADFYCKYGERNDD